MLKPRNLLWIIPIFLLITFPLWRIPLVSFLEPRGGYDPSFGKRDQDVHNFLLENIVILQDQEGQRTAIVRANQAYTTEIPNELRLTEVDADLFSEEGEQVHVIARQGNYNTDTRQLLLKEDVSVVRVSEDQKLFTDTLYYYDETRTIRSPSPTRLVGKNIEINGQSLDYNVATNQYKIGGRVLCTITEDKQ